MKINFLLIAVLYFINDIRSQNVAINNDGSSAHASAMLDVNSISKGLLIPRMTTLQRVAIVSPATGLMVYDTDVASFFFYNGNAWAIISGNSNNWKLTGNTGTDPLTNFIGTADNVSLLFKVNNQWHGGLQNNGSIFWGNHSGSGNTAYSNVGIGPQALLSNTNRGNLVAIGDSALMNNGTGASTAIHSRYNTAIGSKALYANTTGYSNTALGFRSLMNNSTGYQNIAIGVTALNSNTDGYRNLAIGSNTLSSATNSINNIAIGNNALENNTTGICNIALGDMALNANTVASYNIALGNNALLHNINGNENFAMGENSLRLNVSGNYNLAIGRQALQNNTTGDNNVAVGYKAAMLNSTASNNTALGYNALYYTNTGDSNTAVGSRALRDNMTGAANTAIGFQTLANNTGSHNTAIGAEAMYLSTNAEENTAVGFSALKKNSIGNSNTAIGSHTMNDNTTGRNNVSVGAFSLQYNTTGRGNTAIGAYAANEKTTADYTTALGYSAEAYDHLFSTAVGAYASASAQEQVMLGDIYINSVASHAPFVEISDKRFKQNIQEDVHGLDFIMKLKPVTYHYDMAKLNTFRGRDSMARKFQNEAEKNAFDKIHTERRIKKEAIRYSGFAAQDVEQAAKESGYDFSGVKKPQNDKDHYGIAYSQFVVPLVKGMQEQQKMIDDLKKQLEDLRKQISQTR